MRFTDNDTRAMVNPGAFRGSRLTFLTDQKPAYSAAISGGYVADCLADIQRRYFKRYPVTLEHNTEPSPEHLAAIDDNAADPEPEMPDRHAMSEEEYLKAKEAFKARSQLVDFRREVRDYATMSRG